MSESKRQMPIGDSMPKELMRKIHERTMQQEQKKPSPPPEKTKNGG